MLQAGDDLSLILMVTLLGTVYPSLVPFLCHFPPPSLWSLPSLCNSYWASHFILLTCMFSLCILRLLYTINVLFCWVSLQFHCFVSYIYCAITIVVYWSSSHLTFLR